MSNEQTVIYTARSSHEAHLLRNLLMEMGIQAVVQNDLLERGSGVDMVGWPTAVRVVVAEENAEQARQIAMKFERKAAPAAEEPAAEQPSEESASPGEADGGEAAPGVDQWPRCPECDARRVTRCPICHTAGIEFEPIDMGFIWVPSPEGATPTASCQCGPGGCGPQDAAEDQPPSADEPEPPLMLMCPTCDEPFTPEHPQLCEWCGHEFPDGYEVEQPQGTAEEPLDTRVIAVIAGLLALTAGLVGYFMFIV